MGRPQPWKYKLTPEQRHEVYESYADYIEVTDDPNMAGFVAEDMAARKYRVNKDNMNDWPEMRELTLRANAKTEAYLLKKGMGGQGAAMSIFRLKQPTFGYRDKFEQDVTSQGEKIVFTNGVARPDIGRKK